MRLFLLAVLLVLPAFFAAAEVSLLRLRPSRVELLVEEGHAGAQAIQRLQRRLRRALMVSQLGATLALVALGWACLLYTSPSPRDGLLSRMPSSA